MVLRLELSKKLNWHVNEGAAAARVKLLSRFAIQWRPVLCNCTVKTSVLYKERR